MDDKEDILEQLKEGLRQHHDYSIDGRNDIESLTTSSITALDLSDLTYGTGISLGPTFNYPNITITNSGTTAASPWIVQDATTASAKIQLNGEDADIEINGESLCDMIRGIQERLNILCPDPDMEAEWDELRLLREQYDTKLAECREKSRAWKALKS